MHDYNYIRLIIELYFILFFPIVYLSLFENVSLNFLSHPLTFMILYLLRVEKETVLNQSQSPVFHVAILMYVIHYVRGSKHLGGKRRVIDS